MKRTLPLFFSLSALCATLPAQSEEGRFDAQIFRPSAAPRDLVTIQKSEVIGHLSPVIGFYSDISIDPLAIAAITTNREIRAIGARFQLTGLTGIGFYDWFDITLAMPFVAWQTSDNLRSLGSEGSISPTALGDLRFATKIAIPYFNRKEHVRDGFGLAVTGNVNLPTGDQNAFASDGTLTGGFGLIADYRFDFGLIVAANTGLWLRPDRQFAGTKVGDMANFGLGAEMYIVQRWGWSILGGVFGHASLSKFPDSPAQVPAEALLALRFQTDHGFTFTVGGAFGANCGFGAPVFRAFGGIVYTLSTSREQEIIKRIKWLEAEDADNDGILRDKDKCPDQHGPPANNGCPDVDSDGDTIPDRLDDCDTMKGDDKHKGCPPVYWKPDEIIILDPVHFATDKDEILDASTPVLDMVVGIMKNTPAIEAVEIQGHTDIRASDTHNYHLSQRRVESVMRYMIARGIEPARLTAKGFGHTEPAFDDSACNVPDDKLSPSCKEVTSKNRRVVFRIKKLVAPKSPMFEGSKPVISGVPLGKDPVIPNAKDAGILPSAKDGGVIPSGKDAAVIPSTDHTLPGTVLKDSTAILPDGTRSGRSGLPGKSSLPTAPSVSPPKPGPAPAPPPKPGPAPAAPPKPAPAPPKAPPKSPAP